MVCPSCGYELNDSFKFCPECGVRLNNVAKTVDEAVSDTPLTADEVVPETVRESPEPSPASEAEAESTVVVPELAEPVNETVGEPFEGAVTEPDDAYPFATDGESHEPALLINGEKPLNPLFAAVSVVLTLIALALSFLLYCGYFDDGQTAPAFAVAFSEVGSGNVAAQEEIAIENIYIPEKEIALSEGQSKRIKIDVFPRNAGTSGILWSSDGESATVSNDGLVTGITAGSECVVTASSGGVSARITVRVRTKDEAFFEAVEQITNKENYQKIDFIEQNFSPSPIKPELSALTESEARRKWGANLFARINDEIQSYEVGQTRLVNAETGNVVDCDVYRDKPSAGAERGDIRKIVTIERSDGFVKVSDFYYINGKIGFIFEKTEETYSPAPANWGTAGTRLYFEDDALTTWRDVSLADERLMRGQAFVKTDYSIGMNGIEWNHTEYIYDSDEGIVKNLKEIAPEAPDKAEIAAKREEYKAIEERAINAAYNIYSKIAEMPETTNLTGFVGVPGGLPANGATVKLFSEQYGMLVAQAHTKENGTFEVSVPRTEMPYTASVHSEGYMTAYIYNVDTGYVSGKQLSPVVLMPDTVENAAVRISVLNAETGVPAGAEQTGGTLKLRRGINNNSGESAYTVTLPAYSADDENDEPSMTVSDGLQSRYIPESGVYEIIMPPGNYTAELIVTGYENAFFPLHAAGGNASAPVTAALVPKIANGTIKIVLQWDNLGGLDLASHLLLPSGERALSTLENNADDSGSANSADADEPEEIPPPVKTIVVKRLEHGTYNYYVTDNTNISGGNPYAPITAHGAAVTVYSGGDTARFYFPAGAEGAAWHVFNISDGSIIPVEKLYETTDGFIFGLSGETGAG